MRPIHASELSTGDRYNDLTYGMVEIERVLPLDSKYPKAISVDTSRGRRVFDRNQILYIERLKNPRAQTFNFPDIKKALAMGKIVAIEYASVRDGKVYRHAFAGSRPQLAVTLDGKQLVILGGGYRVTERGIEDS